MNKYNHLLFSMEVAASESEVDHVSTLSTKKNPSKEDSATYKTYQNMGWERHFVMLLAAPRKSGKTHLITKLLTEGKMANAFDNIIIASPSLEFTDDYKIEHLTSAMVIKVRSNFHDTITTYIDQQKHANKLHFEQPETYDPIHSLLILDDCIDSRLAAYGRTENIADEIAERGRHFNMSFIGSAQYLTGFSPSLRRNAEYLFTFSPTNYNELERVMHEYVPSQEKRTFFDALKQMFVVPYSFVLIDNSPPRRRFYKLRLRKGFNELVLPILEGELDAPKLDTKRKRKNNEVVVRRSVKKMKK